MKMIDNEFYQRIMKYKDKFNLNSDMLIKMLEWAEIEFDDREFSFEEIGNNEYFIGRERR